MEGKRSRRRGEKARKSTYCPDRLGDPPSMSTGSWQLLYSRCSGF